MHRSTASKLTVVVFGLLVLMTAATEEGRRNLPEVLAGALVIGVLAYLVWLHGKPRERALAAEARERGLDFSAKDPFSTLHEPFDLFRRTAGRSGHVENVLWGRWHGLELHGFDYEYSAGENSVRRHSCVMVAIPGGWPSLVIRPESPLTAAADHVGMRDIGFESERFNRAFEVQCEDRRFASALVDARMMEWLLAVSPAPAFEIAGRWILAYRDRIQPWEIGSLMGLAEAFVERIPRVVGSLYPEALPPRPDRPA